MLFFWPLTGPVCFRAQILSSLLKYVTVHACTGREVVRMYQAVCHVDYLKAEVLPLIINFKEKVLQANAVEAFLGIPLDIDSIFY